MIPPLKSKLTQIQLDERYADSCILRAGNDLPVVVFEVPATWRRLAPKYRAAGWKTEVFKTIAILNPK